MLTAKPSRPLKLNQRAQLAPVGRFAEWHVQAIQTPDLTDLERSILDAVAGYWRLQDERGCALPLTYAALSEATGAEPIAISAAIKRLMSLCLFCGAARPWQPCLGVPAGFAEASRSASCGMMACHDDVLRRYRGSFICSNGIARKLRYRTGVLTELGATDHPAADQNSRLASNCAWRGKPVAPVLTHSGGQLVTQTGPRSFIVPHPADPDRLGLTGRAPPTLRSSKMTRCCRRVSEDLQVADHIDDAAEIEARVKQWWGDRLVPVPESALVGRRLSMRTHSFLTKVGVPRDAPGQVTFYTGDEPLRPLTVAGETYWVVGDDYGTEITLSLRGDVWSIDPEGQLPRRFINTSIAHFVLFLGLYEAEYEGVGDTDNREPVAIEGELRTQFDEYDLFALANAENWWSLVLEQIGQGLL